MSYFSHRLEKILPKTIYGKRKYFGTQFQSLVHVCLALCVWVECCGCRKLAEELLIWQNENGARKLGGHDLFPAATFHFLNLPQSFFHQPGSRHSKHKPIGNTSCRNCSLLPRVALFCGDTKPRRQVCTQVCYVSVTICVKAFLLNKMLLYLPFSLDVIHSLD